VRRNSSRSFPFRWPVSWAFRARGHRLLLRPLRTHPAKNNKKYKLITADGVSRAVQRIPLNASRLKSGPKNLCPTTAPDCGVALALETSESPSSSVAVKPIHSQVSSPEYSAFIFHFYFLNSTVISWMDALTGCDSLPPVVLDEDPGAGGKRQGTGRLAIRRIKFRKVGEFLVKVDLLQHSALGRTHSLA